MYGFINQTVAIPISGKPVYQFNGFSGKTNIDLFIGLNSSYTHNLSMLHNYDVYVKYEGMKNPSEEGLLA